MADIKSAYEIAMEKINKIESATPEERLKWKYIPKGEELAGKYLKDDINLTAELAKYGEQERKYVVQGISSILIRNIDLPKNDAVKKITKKRWTGSALSRKTKKVWRTHSAKSDISSTTIPNRAKRRKKQPTNRLDRNYLFGTNFIGRLPISAASSFFEVPF